MTTPPPPEDAVTQAVRAHLIDVMSPLVAHGLRSGIVRHREGRALAGVSRAIADGTAVPVALIRVTFVINGLLGVGVPLYGLLTLLIPSAEEVLQHEERRAEAGGYAPRVVSLRDILLYVVIGLAMAGAVLWLIVLVQHLLIPALSLGVLSALLTTVVVISAERARHARLVFLISELAQRAGLITADEVREAIELQREAAPRAWHPPTGGAGAGASDPWGPGAASAGEWRERRRSTVSVAAIIAAGALALTALSLLGPSLPLPGLANVPLPEIPMIAAAAGVMALLAGLVLIVTGSRGRASRAVAVLGTVALLLNIGGTAWGVRMLERGAEPRVVTLDRFEPGQSFSCPTPGPHRWGRPVVLDLSAMRVPASTAEVRRQWEEIHGARAPADMPLAMAIHCDAHLADVTVILPPQAEGVRGVIATQGGESTGEHPRWGLSDQVSGPQVVLSGTVTGGDVHYERPAG